MNKAKNKTCVVCGSGFQPFRSTQRVCSKVCAIAYAKEKERVKFEKEARKERREFYNSDPSTIKKKLQTVVNEIARLIDYGLPCLATGNNGGQMHGGHVFTRGAHGQMRYNLHNIHRQSAHSNHKQSHDALMQEMLADEYGDEYLERLKLERGAEQIQLSPSEWFDTYGRARKFRNELKRDLRLRTVHERIELRNKANEVIGLGYTY